MSGHRERVRQGTCMPETRLGRSTRMHVLQAYVRTLVGLMAWKMVLTLGLMIGLGLTEGVGVLTLVPILRLVGLEMQQGPMSRVDAFVLSIFTTMGIRPTLPAILGIYVLIISTHALLHRCQTTASLSLQYEFVARLRQRLYQAIVKTNWLFFVRCRAADLTHALTTELDRVGLATYHLLLLLANVIITSVYLFLALQLSVLMTALVCACGTGLLVLLRRKTQAAQVTGEGLSLATNGLYTAAIEHLSGMKTVKSYGTEHRNLHIFSNLAERIARMQMSAVRSRAEVKCWFDIGSVLTLSFILYMALEVLALRTAGVLLLLFLFARVTPKLSTIQQSHHYFVHMLPAFHTVMGIQARCEAAVEPRAEQPQAVELRHSIRLEQVSFSYDATTATPVIANLDLCIRTGQTSAIVGPSGAGKSTIADLILGLLEPTQGRVWVDEIPLSPARMQSWRDQIGYVAQDTFLFHDTIRANLLWACPDASDKDIWRALSLAAAQELVATLPQGLETVLGDRGVRLSGGERQRLALARALLRQPSVLILDEATSALDSENERHIQSAIEELRGHMTILIIAHRLSTIRGADIIHVLERGRVVESGDWQTLMATENGRFGALCRAQGIEEGYFGGF